MNNIILIPPGYKSSPLGPIPNDWDIKKLEDISIVQMGQSPDSENYNNQGKGLPLIQGNADMQFGKSIQRIWTMQITKKCNEGDIILSVRAPVGSVGVASYESCIGRGVCSIRGAKIDHALLYYLLQYREKNWIKLIQGSTFESVTTEQVKNSIFLIPPFQEQNGISKLISTWDEAISKVSKLIEQHEKRKIWIIQRLFNSQTSRVSAGEVFKSTSIKGTSNEILLSATQDRGIIPRDMLGGRVTMPNNGETEGYKLVEVGDFVISLRSFQGGLEYSGYRGVVSPAYIVLKSKKKISSSYYRYYFKSYDFIGHLSIAVVGIRDGKQISYDDFCTVKIPDPSYDDQIFAATILEKADQEIQLLKGKLEKFKEQKKGLMQQLLTGKKRLKF